MAGMTIVKERAAIAAPSGGPNITWTTVTHYRDVLAPKAAIPDRPMILRELHAEKVALPEPLRFTSLRVVPAMELAYPEVLHTDEAMEGTAADIKVARSGTTDTNMLGDGWVDAVPLNQGVNHGNETPLQVGSENIVATTANAFFEWDLTRFANLMIPTVDTGTMRLRFWIDIALVAVLETISFACSKKTSRPFTESTLNWTNRPAVGTDLVTKSLSNLVRLDIATPRFQIYDVNLTAAEYSAFLGSWLMVRCHSTVLIATPFRIASREAVDGGGSTTGEKPLLTLDFRRA